MSSNFILNIKNLFAKSELPAAIADSKSVILWKNKASKMIFSVGETFFERLSEDHPKTGTADIFSDADDMVMSFNIIAFNAPDERKKYHIIELIHTESAMNIANNPAFKGYVKYICSKIKDSACIVASSLDELHDAVSCGIYDGEMLINEFNTIDKGMLTITKEMIQPDQFYELAEMEDIENSDNVLTFLMDSELEKAAKAASSVLGKNVEVKSECEKNIFFRMSRSLFETVIGGMTENVCREVFPEKLLFSAKRTDENRAEVSVSSLSSKKKSPPRVTFEENIGRNIFFDYICEILSRTINAVFTRSEVQGGCVFRMEFDVISKNRNCVAMISSEFTSFKGRFDTIPLMLAEFSQVGRYDYYDMDADDDCKEKRMNLYVSSKKEKQ